MNQELLEYAMYAYDHLGLSFTPTLPGESYPITKGWNTAPRETKEDIIRWIRQEKNLAVRAGEPSGGILIIDFDTDKPEFSEAAAEYLNLPHTVIATTPSGGYHYYFRYKGDLKLRNTSGEIAPAVDTKYTNGAACFAGSVRDDGCYMWLVNPESTEIAEVPEHIIELLKPKPQPEFKPVMVQFDADDLRQAAYLKSILDSEISHVANCSEGCRNATVNLAAFNIGQLVGGGCLAYDEAFGMLLNAAGLCGYPSKEAVPVIKGGLKSGMAKPRSVPEKSQKTTGAERSDAARSVHHNKKPSQKVSGAQNSECQSATGAEPSEAARSRPNNNPAQPAAFAPLNASASQSDKNCVTQKIKPEAINALKSTISPERLNEDDEVNIGYRDRLTGKLVLDPTQTLPTADAFISEFAGENGIRTIHYHKKDLYIWRDNAYQRQDPEILENWLYPWLHNAAFYGNGKPGRRDLINYFTKSRYVKDVANAILSRSLIPGNFDMPCYLSGDNSKPDPREILSCKNGNLHVPSMQLLAKDPDLFSSNALSFDYDPESLVPASWFKFLNDIWPDDPEAIQLLKEWFGYCLTADTSQQKILLIKGPKRSGKGTIAKILQALVGKSNFAGMLTSTFAGNFGLEMLIGKSVACFSDARFDGQDTQTIVERLLTISGEDTVMIDRKGIRAVTVRLPLKMMLLTNELPRLKDSAGALAGRFLMLTQTESFFGREDHGLEARLMKELPGILAWALAGWHDLNKRGTFSTPASSKQAETELGELSSPITGFVNEMCVLGSLYEVSTKQFYEAYTSWAEDSGVKRIPTAQTLGKDLSAAIQGLQKTQRRAGRFYLGIGLKAHYSVIE